MTDGGARALPAYDAGRLLEPHGASDDWWHDAIREILASAHAHYVRHAADLCPAVFALAGSGDPSIPSIGPGNVSSAARIVDRSASGAGGDLASAVAAAVMGLEWTGRGLHAGRSVDEAEADRRHGSVQAAVSDVLARRAGPEAGMETQTADHIAALAVTSEDVGRELTLAEVLEAGFKRYGYSYPAEVARKACETIAAGPLPPLAPGLPPDRIARAIFDHPLMQAVERSASQRWLTKAEQMTVASTVGRLALVPSCRVDREEIARLKDRLEITHAYDGAGNQIPFPAGMEHLDGIACRDETIRGLDGIVAALKDRTVLLEGALRQILGQYIVNRGDLTDAEALEAIRQLCERSGQGGDR